MLGQLRIRISFIMDVLLVRNSSLPDRNHGLVVVHLVRLHPSKAKSIGVGLTGESLSCSVLISSKIARAGTDIQKWRFPMNGLSGLSHRDLGKSGDPRYRSRMLYILACLSASVVSLLYGSCSSSSMFRQEKPYAIVLATLNTFNPLLMLSEPVLSSNVRLRPDILANERSSASGSMIWVPGGSDAAEEEKDKD